MSIHLGYRTFFQRVATLVTSSRLRDLQVTGNNVLLRLQPEPYIGSESASTKPIGLIGLLRQLPDEPQEAFQAIYLAEVSVPLVSNVLGCLRLPYLPIEIVVMAGDGGSRFLVFPPISTDQRAKKAGQYRNDDGLRSTPEVVIPDISCFD